MATPRTDPFRTDLARLGLQEDPFQLSADPRFLYLGEEHQEVYKTIQAVIIKRRGLALVTGKPGTGKSSLARYTYDRLFGRDGIDVAYIDTSNFDTRAAAARKIATSFNTLNIELGRSYSDQMENFKLQVVQANKQGHLVVLLLDDAQKLKRPHLEMLHEMYNFDYGEKAITVIAFGEDAAVKNFYRYPSISSRLYTIQSLKSRFVRDYLADGRVSSPGGRTFHAIIYRGCPQKTLRIIDRCTERNCHRRCHGDRQAR